MKKIFFLITLFYLLATKPILAASYYSGDLSQKFKETEVFNFNSANQVVGYFQTTLKNYKTGTLPPSVSINGSSVTLSGEKVGIAIDNPLKNEPFYKVEYTLTDSNQQDLIGYLTMIDTWWADGVFTNGLSVGIDTTKTKSTYWYWQTDFKTPGNGVTQEQYDWSLKALNKFIKRKTGDIKVEIYVTPIGTYPVVNGANFGSFPDTYIGPYTFHHPTTFNYLVFNKYNAGGDPVTFKDLKIIKLDNTIANVDEVNAFFLKKTVESGAFSSLINNATNNVNGSSGFQNNTWLAFVYRGYDYYFKTNHVTQVQQLVDTYLSVLTGYLDQQLARYGQEPTININHSLINGIQGDPAVIYGISGYLRPDQKENIRIQYARIVDKTMEYIKSDGSFPAKIQYKGNNPSDETGWLMALYTYYLLNYPNDQPRIEKIQDYLSFLGFIHLSDGYSIRQVYGNSVTFKYLDDSYRDFVAQYIWNTGETDHHGFHPSLNYGKGYVAHAALARNILEKLNLPVPPTITRNMDKVYQTTVANNLNIQTFHLNHPNPRYPDGIDPNTTTPIVQQDVYTFDSTDGSIIDVVGMTNPSLLEDWTTTFVDYSINEYYGDYALSTPFAKNIYYGFYSGTGRLFCGHVDVGNGQKCSAGTDNFYGFMFSNPLFSMLFSKRSNFDPSFNPDKHINISDFRNLLQSFISIFDYNKLVEGFGK